MGRLLRPPLFAIALALVALLLLLATLQYVWLGRISDAQRDRLRASVAAGTSAFAQDFDRELTRAYLLFQAEPAHSLDDAAERFAARYDRWLATSQYPRLLKEFFLVRPAESDDDRPQRFDPVTRQLDRVEWPASMAGWRDRIGFQRTSEPGTRGMLMVRRIAAPIWESVPALIVPTPLLLLGERGRLDQIPPPSVSYAILTIDLEYVRTEMLPLLTERHFGAPDKSVDFQVAVVDLDAPGNPIYRSTDTFSPSASGGSDGAADFFQVRTQEFGTLVSEMRHFIALTATGRPAARGVAQERPAVRAPQRMSIFVQGARPEAVDEAVGGSTRASAAGPHWRVVVRHSAGSLEAAVNSTRRRNLIVSSSILAVLGASMALLVISTRRSQELARRQMEFVAAVSHELRTPLAVIRSAGDNLADGVVLDASQVRQYGALVRGEGRRLSAMVEQILEFAGMQPGGRSLSRQPVAIGALVGDIVSTSASLIEGAGLRATIDVPTDLPPVIGDEAALRRVFQNLIANAIKYGAQGGWIGVRANSAGGEVTVSVIDRGVGIPAAEQARIFEPFYRGAHALATQIQGAGLGLSLVARIVEAHGARITVKSVPGEGSEFAVHLRAADAESVREEHGVEAPRYV